ncbi:MAG: MoaD/ThiS family protein [Methanothrix sp.]|nr:MoaD/ThiS family protein [Methanothrix sp.]
MKAFAGLSEILGREQDLYLEEGSTLCDLLDLLSRKSPGFRDAAFDASGRLLDHIILIRNGSRVDRAAALHEGDCVAVLPPFSGG